jgi:hypothetical protein
MNNNWIKSQQNGALINLDNLADIIIKKVKNEDHQVLGYTSSGFGIVIFRGSEVECTHILGHLVNLITPKVI